jgi:hypothetical protein
MLDVLFKIGLVIAGIYILGYAMIAVLACWFVVMVVKNMRVRKR